MSFFLASAKMNVICDRGYFLISQRVLTDNLRTMESDGIITRTVYPEVPVRVEYALSELEDTMRPIINSMFEWGTMYQGLVKE